MTHKHTLIQTQAQLVHTQTPTKMMYTKTQTQGHTQIEGKYIILMDKPLHWRHPLATCTKYKPVSSKMTISSFWYGILCHFVFFGNYYLPISVLSDECRATCTKTFWRKAEETKFVCVNHLLFFYRSILLRKPKPRVVCKDFSQIWKDQWPCWGHFGSQQLVPLWAYDW